MTEPCSPTPKFTLYVGDEAVQLEQLDALGGEWFAENSSRRASGSLRDVLAVVCREPSPAWLDAVLMAVAGDRHASVQRAGLVVTCSSGVRFHTSRAVNRRSILEHGLDWRRMVAPGVAGSRQPEWPGVFLTDELESAEWFVDMAGGAADIWQAVVDGLWLISDPSASGGLQDGWAIALSPIGPDRLTLYRAAGSAP